MNIFEILKTIPKVGQILMFLKSLPALIKELELLLQHVEISLDEAGKAGGFDPTAGKAAIDKAVALLDQAQSGLEVIVGK